ncbi:putative T7SS-secreted protein [Nocardia rhizosphaerae]|uniref:T7SS-secreted protein n=1 Tax=Nocardia rhizosphaerae TaxID=1691571 RepID=A0ABV8LEA1_9NOCA
MGIGDFLNGVGDAIEDGLESAAEKVGQAYNTVLDAESKVAKAVGADGLSEWLDDLGDKVVDATGGSVPEKELGETEDPKELIRGDVGKINEVTEHLGTIGTAIDQTGDALRKIDTADWTGDAATAFDEEFAKQPKLWWDGADAMGKAKAALDAWSHEVTAAQTKAQEAIAKWQQADQEERDRKNAWNALTDDQREGKNLTDTWTDLRNAARAMLSGARTQRDNAANTAVTAIDAATALAPTEPPFLSRWGSNFEDLGAAIDHAKLNFSTGLLTSLTGMVQFVRAINPADLYNVTHPAEYMSKMSDLGTGMVLAAADPKATASAMLAGFKTNPSEALGALTGDALLTVATGGAGGAAKTAATVVDKASDASRVTRVIDDAAGAGSRNSPDAPSTQPATTRPDNPAAPETAPAAPATNPAATTPDNPAATNPAATTDNAGSTTPETTTPGTHTDDAAPNGATTPNQDGTSPNPASTSPEGRSPDNDAGAPVTPDRHDGENPVAATDPGNPATRHDEDGTTATDPEGDSPSAATDPGSPAAKPDDDGPAGGDPDDGTQPGGVTGPDGSPDQPNTPEGRATTDAGGNGEPSVGEQGQRNPPETDSTRDQTCEGGDPVNIATGEFLLPLTDIDLPGILRLVLKRAHHSNYRHGRWFGPSWSATLDLRVVVEEECVTVVFDDGMLLPYPHAEVGVGVEPIAGGQRWRLTRTETGGYRLWDPDRELVWHFAPEPALDGLDTLLGNFAISAITDRHQNRIRFHYNSNGDPIEISHSGGYRIGVDTEAGRVTALSVLGTADDSELRTTVRRFGYEHGELTTETNGIGGTTRFAYDNEHRMLSWTDDNGSWVANTYDEAGRVVAQRGLGGTMNADFEYVEFGNGSGKLTRLTDSRGGATGYGFDTDLRLRDIVAPDGGRRHIDYNPHRKPLAVTEPDGATTRYTYTADGDVATITRPDGTDITIDYTYPNRPATITNADGTTVHREWDKLGNLVAVTDAAGARTQFSHNDIGAVTEVRDPDGGITRIDVDATGLPITITDPYGATTTITRDPFGRPSSVTDPLGQTTRYEWTPAGKPARRTDPDGYHETWTYDGENNLLTHTDRNGGRTRYTYGGFDKVATRTDPDGSTTRYLYNTELQLTAVINPLGQRWTYDYDLTRRLISETDYTGATTTYTHTATGRIATVTPATGITRHHRYDVLGNLTSITADTGEYLAYTHDPAGRVLTAVNGTDETRTHTLRFTYTPTGQVATQQLDDQPPMVNTYDHRSRRTQRTTPTGAITTWHHNTLGHVTAMTADNTDITFTHDRAGRLTGWRIGEVRIDRTFTPTGTIASQEVTGFPAEKYTLDLGDFDTTANRPTPFTIRRDDYTYRPDGYLTHHTTTHPDTGTTHATYTLDPIGRVNTITRDNTLTEAYEYDALSNITASLPTTPDPATTPPSVPPRMEGREYHNNLLTRDGRNHYYYDPAGRLIRKVTTRISRKPAVWHYRYNAFDQLTDVYTPEKEWWQYKYDAHGRRTEKAQIQQQAARDTLARTTFFWDGYSLTSEYDHQHSSTLQWDFLPRTLTPLLQSSMNAEGGTTQRVLPNGYTGATSELVEPYTCSITSRSHCDLWGTVCWHGEDSTPLRSPGQYYDQESGLHFSLFRIYDPSTGLFTTSDPLGLIPADNNRAYPRNPTRWSDPLGLSPDTDCGGNTNGGTWNQSDAPYLYRGVPHQGPLDPEEFQRMYQNALEGIAEPRGGSASAGQHVGGNTESPYTSWTTDYEDVALDAATELPGPGVVMRIPNADGPGYHRVGGIDYPYDESEVTIMGRVSGADVRVVGGPWRTTGQN